MMARVGVGTIDQAMLSVMAVRHGWMRAAWLVDRLLVIDEVHASDPYMEAVIGSLVRRHLDLNGHVLCLSATLGESMRSRLLGHPPAPPADAVRIPYPVVWAGSLPVPVDPVGRREVQVEMIDDPAGDAIRAASEGATVLVIRSTVGDAVETWESIRALGPTPLLHHSRWADEDRRYLDGEVLRCIGREGRRPGAIVIGTQTLEQSLDIDADLLITDACPADVLLQRLGRLHRHDRDRPPGYEQPRALLVDPTDMGQYVSPTGRVSGRQGQGWAWVYPVLSVAATVDWIRGHGCIRVPEDSRALVERATHPEYLLTFAEHLGTGWQRLFADTYGSAVAERQQGGLCVVDWSVPYQRAEVDSHPTRLGDGTVTIETPGLRSPLTGPALAAVPVPARWLRGVDEDTSAIVDGQTITIGPLEMRYGEQGLQRL
jgi:CRISPR-associated endonuclease/helicase Cas3